MPRRLYSVVRSPLLLSIQILRQKSEPTGTILAVLIRVNVRRRAAKDENYLFSRFNLIGHASYPTQPRWVRDPNKKRLP